MKIKPMAFLLFFLWVGSSSVGAVEEQHWHYFDKDNQPLTQCEPVYDQLKVFFRDQVPAKIKVVYTNRNRGQYDKVNQRVLIGQNRNATNYIDGVAHESCHLAMVLWTKEASTREEFRFFDEGFANIFEAIFNHSEADYKKKALTVAAVQYGKNNLSFTKVQKWSVYFGNPQIKATSYAYPVGSSFDYYIIDTFGMEKLFDFFRDIGRTRDWDASLQNVFQHDIRWIETQWVEYIKKVKITEPQIIKRVPEQGATQVSPATSEIYVEFDTPMSRPVFISTNFNDAIRKTVYWKNSQILVIKVNLVPDFQYQISLGVNGSGNLTSRSGVELPVTLWTFTTDSK